EEHRRRGMSGEEARQAALRDFGGVTQVRETVREREGWPLVENLRRDVGYALRQMRRAPGFTAMVVLTLALGIGANTAIFLLTWSLLLKSLPVKDPGRLVLYTFLRDDSQGHVNLSYPLYAEIQQHQTTTRGMFAWWNDTGIHLDENGGSTEISAGLATGGVFRVLDLHPYIGRGFEENTGERGQPFEPEVLLGYDFWRSHFNADPRILGQTIELSRIKVTVIGVLPRGFDGIFPETPIDVLLPLSYEKAHEPKTAMMDEKGAFWLTVMGRLKPGQSVASAQAAATDLSRTDPDLTLHWGSSVCHLTVEPGRRGESGLREQYRDPLLALEALSALMMALCAVNTALLILARVSGRLHEFAVRSALGATRRRLVVQVLLEALLQGAGGLALGGVLGWDLAHGLVHLVSPLYEVEAMPLRAGAMVVLFAVVLSMAAALLAGLWPAWRASRTAPALELKQLHQLSRSSRLGRWLIPTQVALGIVLIYAALLMTGTLRNYLRENSGFVPHGVTFAELNDQTDDPFGSAQVRKRLQIADALEHAPGIQSATLLSMPPVHGWDNTTGFFTRDPAGNLRQNDAVWQEGVTPGYFATMGTAILEGRSFAWSDLGGDTVCVISRAAARFFFPGQDPIGRFLTEGDGKPPKSESGTGAPTPPSVYRVVGVAEDARMQSLLSPAPVTVYKLIEQAKSPWATSFLAVRSATPGIAAEAIRETAARILPGAPPPKIYSFDRVVDNDLSQQRLLSSVSGGFALLALALVATGLYGILARAVTERRREIGIRMALGAQREAIVAHLARGAFLRVGLGVAAGGGLAWLAGHWLRSLLFGISAHSLPLGLATVGLLLVVLLAAFVVPAGRAASIQPMEAIREE
ncbi:MAG: ADOP family duplicated permease, partial [Acidobacteriaceae bacterium]